MSSRPRIIIFGAGGAGRRAYRFHRHKFDVVAFADNDPRKHGTTFEGIPVISPAGLDSVEWDQVFIASMYDEQIFRQLVESGVPATRIEVVDRSVILGDEATPWGCWLAMIVGIAAAIAAVLWCLAS